METLYDAASFIYDSDKFQQKNCNEIQKITLPT